jgi:hypothetical protein
MTVALKAARVCLQAKELDSATKVLERAADYQDILGKLDDECKGGENNRIRRSTVEYFVLRTALVNNIVR